MKATKKEQLDEDIAGPSSVGAGGRQQTLGEIQRKKRKADMDAIGAGGKGWVALLVRVFKIIQIRELIFYRTANDSEKFEFANDSKGANDQALIYTF